MRNRSVFALFVALLVSVAACGDGGEPVQDDAAVDPCAACSSTATCDPNGSPVCACPTGYTGDGTTAGTGCTDIDECTLNNCVDGAAGGTCTNTAGSVTCGCQPGYTGDGTQAGTGCTNVDECTANTDDCVEGTAGGTCTDTAGGFTCGCATGYSGDGTASGTGCTNVDECATSTDDCIDATAGGTCMDTAGGFTCGCATGYTGDGSASGTGCTNIDECATSTDTCVDTAGGGACMDTAGGFTCGCATGYTGDGSASGTGCTNVDECAMNTDTCVDAAAGGTCMDTIGGFTCGCATGYTGDGSATGTGCSNTDECAMNTDNCLDASAGGACTDTPGGFTCGCATGFTGDGLASGTGCNDIDECAVADACGYTACTNTVGSFSCSVIYGASAFQNFGWVIHPTTFEVIGSFESSLPGSTVTGLNSIASDPTTGIQYAIAKVSGVSGRVLVTVDFQPGVANLTPVGNLGDNFSSLAFRDDGQLFGVTGNGAAVPETLFLIDKATATTTVATALGNGEDGEVIVYNPDDDFFYHFSGNGTIVYEKIESAAPYTVTNIPISGLTNGETFGGMYLGNGQILVSNISAGFNVVGTDGTWGAVFGAMPDDLRGLVKANVSPNAFRVTPSTVLSAGGDTVTVTGSFCADTSGFSIGSTSVAATIAPDQITFTTPATPAGPQALTATGGSANTSHIGTLTFVDILPRQITGTGNDDVAPESDDLDEVGCSAGTSEGLGALCVLGFAVFIPRRRRRRRA